MTHSVTNKTHRWARGTKNVGAKHWTLGAIKQFISEAEKAGFVDGDEVRMPSNYLDALECTREDILVLPTEVQKP